MKVLVTCPPMLGMMQELRDRLAGDGIELTCPTVTQTLTVPELLGTPKPGRVYCRRAG